MGKQSPLRNLTRRNFLKLGGGLAAITAGAALLPAWKGRILPLISPAEAATLQSPAPTVFRHLIGSDGWIQIPMGTIKNANGAVLAPDSLAPAGRTTYIFGFRDVTVLDGGPTVRTPATTTNPLILAQKNKVQSSAPLLFFDENDSIQMTLTNLGLGVRPDLTDPHTIHWHGFRNATPIFDGVPEMSISVPIGRDFPYYYHPTDPGTYMYHCHNEDVEHVQMGMAGLLFVRPAQNKTGNGAGAPIARYNGGSATAPLGYVYNDGVALNDPRSTAYAREFNFILTDMWAQSHYDDAHIQVSDWSDFHADFYLMNGRSYPDTLAPNGGGTDLTTGDLIAPAGRPDLQSQPISSLVQCNAGEKVLLRFANLGYTQPSMKLTGIQMRVVGKDATPLRGLGSTGVRNGADTSYVTDTIHLGAGESFDALFTAPPKTGAGYDTYLLYNNAFGALVQPGIGGVGLGGQMTEVRVYAAGTLPAQTAPNT
ncbi:MAG: multicopper oxidase domain-containing protein [Caldilineaceae bacterium]